MGVYQMLLYAFILCVPFPPTPAIKNKVMFKNSTNTLESTLSACAINLDTNAKTSEKTQCYDKLTYKTFML